MHHFISEELDESKLNLSLNTCIQRHFERRSNDKSNDASGIKKIKKNHLLTSIISMRNSTDIEIIIDRWSYRNMRLLRSSLSYPHIINRYIKIEINNAMRNNYYLVKLEKLTEHLVKGKMDLWLNKVIFFLQTG